VLAVEGRPLAEIARAHWQKYGRHYYQRHDYEEIDAPTAEAVMQAFAGGLAALPGQALGDWTVSAADEFSYRDRHDGSFAVNQGLRIVCGERARIVLRLSGTGTRGATLRIYLERYEREAGALDWRPEDALAPLAAAADRIGRIGELTGRRAPTLVT
jgi:phosphoglucomutase